MTYPDGPRIRDFVSNRLDLVESLANKRKEEGREEYADGIRKAVLILRSQLIGSGDNCVITPLDPRRDDPEWSEFFAEVYKPK